MTSMIEHNRREEYRRKPGRSNLSKQARITHQPRIMHRRITWLHWAARPVPAVVVHPGSTRRLPTGGTSPPRFVRPRQAPIGACTVALYQPQDVCQSVLLPSAHAGFVDGIPQHRQHGRERGACRPVPAGIIHDKRPYRPEQYVGARVGIQLTDGLAWSAPQVASA